MSGIWNIPTRSMLKMQKYIILEQNQIKFETRGMFGWSF
jgi:hypothetical protein